MTFETPKLPEVKFSKNGYEIRSDILAMAKDLVNEDFHVKFNGWEIICHCMVSGLDALARTAPGRREIYNHELVVFDGGIKLGLSLQLQDVLAHVVNSTLIVG